MEPLALQMRPKEIKDVVGQDDVKEILINQIAAKKLSSCILYGPPGTGKTTLALLISAASGLQFKKLSAVSDGIKELRELIKSSEESEEGIVLFIDEIHRWNKSQQDALLPLVESARIILVGATTESPSYQINNALLSRLRVYKLENLTDEQLSIILKRALDLLDKRLTKKGANLLLLHSQGDARKLLGGLERASIIEEDKENISVENLEKALGDLALNYSQGAHYDTISALIKSMRVSDAKASLYYLARMRAFSEDPLFVARRLVIFASEDVGLANEQALPIAVAAYQATKEIGVPECWINLAHAISYLALSDKSRVSYQGLIKAGQAVQEQPQIQIPEHLKPHSDAPSSEFNLPQGVDF